MKRKRKIILEATVFFFLAAACLSLSGCFGGKELNERAFVQLMGIEGSAEGYTVSLQLYKGSSSDGSPDISKANSASVKGSGATLSAALGEAGLEAGKELFLGHTKLIIIGNGISDPAGELAAFTGTGEISPSCPVVYCREPSKVTELELEEGLYSADRIISITDSYVKSGKCVYTSVASLSEDTLANGAASPLPVLIPEEKTVRYEGIAIADGAGIYPGVTDDDAAGLIILRGKYPYGGRLTVTAPVGNDTVSASVTDAAIKRSAENENGKLRINADIKIRLDIKGKPEEVSDEEIYSAVCGSLRDSCISAYSSAVWYGGRDVFELYKLIRRDCPELLSRDREELLRGSVLDITVRAKDSSAAYTVI